MIQSLPRHIYVLVTFISLSQLFTVLPYAMHEHQIINECKVRLDLRFKNRGSVLSSELRPDLVSLWTHPLHLRFFKLQNECIGFIV